MSLLRASLLIALLGPAHAADWPQFLGPARDGRYPGTDLAATWPKDGPPTPWQKPAGSGWSGPVVAVGKVILFHRLGDRETVECLEAATGKAIWKQDFATRYTDDFGFENGPRSTPAIAGERVFVFGANGDLHALDFATGKPLWSVSAPQQFSAGKGFFGFACSPLVEGNAVLLNLGGREGAGIVAFDTATGKALWQATDEEASYSSPIATTIAGQRHALFLTRHKLVSLDPANGRARFTFDWGPQMHASVSGSVPVVSGDLVFITVSYGGGAAALRVKATGVEKAWSSGTALTSQYATPVLRDGFLYGFDGRVDTGPAPELRCVEMATGNIRWRTTKVGHGSLLLAGESVFVLTQQGELVRVAAQPGSFQELARAQVAGSDLRAHPALADGRLFVKSKNRLVCVDLRGK